MTQEPEATTFPEDSPETSLESPLEPTSETSSELAPESSSEPTPTTSLEDFPESSPETLPEFASEAALEAASDPRSGASLEAVLGLSPGDDAEMTFAEDEDFGLLMEENTKSDIGEYEICNGTVTAITKDHVVVDIGFKSEGRIDVRECQDREGELDVAVGDQIEVLLEAIEGNDGTIQISRDKAKKLRIWDSVGEVYEAGNTVKGVITSRIKGGLSVDIGIRAFLPSSQVDLRPIRNLDSVLGSEFEFKILKFNRARANIVLSRRALLEVDRDHRRKKTLATIEEGTHVKGYVKNITDYGAFVDLGGVDGLLHITDMTWGRISHPSDLFHIGDEVDVVVLKFDRQEEKISLGYKQTQANPWAGVAEKYLSGSRHQGRIVSLTDYGAFVELEPGVEGLVHVSEMSWTRKVRHPSKLFEIGQQIEVVVKGVESERRRISLSIKATEPNPWHTVASRFPVGSIVLGKVRNITDFGIFVGLEEGIDGLVHISDLSWSQRHRRPANYAARGEELEVKVLHIDADRERLSLGIKQLSDDPWKRLEERIHINEEVRGKIVNVTDFGFFVEVLPGVEGLIHISAIDENVPKEDLPKYFKAGQEITALVVKVDVEGRRLGLSLAHMPEMLVPEEDTSSSAATAEGETEGSAGEQLEEQANAEGAEASAEDAANAEVAEAQAEESAEAEAPEAKTAEG